MMPHMDGLETFKELRKNSKLADASIIFMTAKIQQQDIDYYRKLGAADVVAKPFDPIALVYTIQGLLEKSSV